ncbi:hypothetical protein D3C87_215700 [compost metagenome]
MSVTSCKKIPVFKLDEETIVPEVPLPTPEYYITYKVDGVTITATEVSALRGITDSPRTLTISGNAKNGSIPKFKFFSEESFIGFVPGLNVWSSKNSYPTHYIEYTNSTGTSFSTENIDEGTFLFVSEASYKNGGNIKGSFNGTVQNEKGVKVKITDGVFNVKFSN